MVSNTMEESFILKLTPQSQYGIKGELIKHPKYNFEVDSTESVWYNGSGELDADDAILKLTPQSQYGITAR